MDERTLTARFKSWVDEALARDAFRPINGADVETHPGNDLRRHDLILRASGAAVFTAEFKMPTDVHGASPRGSLHRPSSMPERADAHNSWRRA
jgi:hypothetical protein